MPPTSAPSENQGDAPLPDLDGTPAGEPGATRVRERGDACPGALRPHQAADGPLVRLRLPGGLLTSRQAEVLAGLAERLADGRISITSRGNVELRGLRADAGDAVGAVDELSAALGAAGLLPSPRHERVRNVLASPLAGLDGPLHDPSPVREWARELDGLLCAEDWTAGLSGRFLFALDDGRGDVAALGGDVTLLAETGGTAVVRTGDPAGGALRVAAADAPRAALAAAEAFLTSARAAGTGAWRVHELPPGHAPEVAAALRRAGIPAEPADRTAVPVGGIPGTGPTPGLVPGRGGTAAVSVQAPLGRLTVAQWRALSPAPAGELRLTPWRGVVLPGFTPETARRRLRELAGAGLVTRADSPWRGVGACTGRPGCASSHADVRAEAAAAAGASSRGRDGARSPAGAVPGPQGVLPVYFSGCGRRCGRPPGDHVDATATADGHYEVTVRRPDAPGSAGAPAAQVAPVTTAELAATVARARTMT